MKIIITEEQLKMFQETDPDFNKTKSLILSMYDDNYTIEDIKKFTGLSNDIIILCLKDVELTGENLSCEEIHDYLYDVLWYSNFIDENKTFNDGTSMEINIDTYEPTIVFEYNHFYGNSVDGYGTFLYQGGCSLPIDLIGTKLNGEYMGDKEYHLGYVNDFLNYPEFKKIKTMGDIINFFNTYYFNIIKKKLDEYLESQSYFFD